MDPVFLGIAKELRANGVKVEVVPGWKSRERPGTFVPKGKMNHHTASPSSSGPRPALGIVTNGRSDLPGPLANFLAPRNGGIVIVAAGRCNHGGIGGPFRFVGKDAANATCLSVEIENNGVGEKYPPEQMRDVEILNAVLLKRLDRGHWYSIGHKEYTSRKIDPSFDMEAFRKRVRRTIQNLGRKTFIVTATKTREIVGRAKARAWATRMRSRGFEVTIEEQE
jgi:hypothetical protein